MSKVGKGKWLGKGKTAASKRSPKRAVDTTKSGAKSLPRGVIPF